jgi:hypothetical protein
MTTIREFANNLRRLASETPPEVARVAAPTIGDLVREEYPAEHVRTGDARDSLTATAEGPVVTVDSDVAYTQYVPGAIPTEVRPSFVVAFDDAVQSVIDDILGGG